MGPGLALGFNTFYYSRGVVFSYNLILKAFLDKK